MSQLTNKTALVTGANSGMGMATVEALSDAGATDLDGPSTKITWNEVLFVRGRNIDEIKFLFTLNKFMEIRNGLELV